MVHVPMDQLTSRKTENMGDSCCLSYFVEKEKYDLKLQPE